MTGDAVLVAHGQDGFIAHLTIDGAEQAIRLFVGFGGLPERQKRLLERLIHCAIWLGQDKSLIRVEEINLKGGWHCCALSDNVCNVCHCS